MKTLKLRYLSVTIKIIIVYGIIIAVFAAAFFLTYYFSKVEIGNKLIKVNEEYFLNKVGYIEATFKDIKNNAYELRNNFSSMNVEKNNNSLDKFEQINRLTRVVNYYNYLDDVFIYDSSKSFFVSTEGSMDIGVYFRMAYFDDELTGKWSDLVNSNDDIITNITKYPNDEPAMRKDYYKRLLYIDIDYFNNSKIIVGFIIDIEKVIRNENYKNADLNNFFVIKNDNGKALQDFLNNNFELKVKGSSLKTDEVVNLLLIKNNIIFYQIDTKRDLIYLNIVNIEKYYERLGYNNILPIIIVSLLLMLIIFVTSSFLSRFYRHLKSIRCFIEGSFVKNVLDKQSGISYIGDVKDFIGLSGIKQISVIMLSANIKSINVQQVDTHNYDRKFNQFLNINGIHFKSFDFLKLKRIYIIDAKSMKNYSEAMKSMQKFLNDYSDTKEQISINLFASGIFHGTDGIEKAIDEVVYLSENVSVGVRNKVIVLENDMQEEYKYMPDEFKNILSNSIACADKQIAVSLIREIISKNIGKGTSVNNFKTIILRINVYILEVIFERCTECYDESVKAVNKINNLIDEVGAEYLIYLYEELMSVINISQVSNENKVKSKLQKCFINYIEENYSKDIYLETMAEYLNLSTKYLSSKFKEITGENFTDYLRHYRIKIAKDMLENSQQKINEISEKVGYNNVNVFIRHFKSIEGITPKSYREIN